MKDPSRLRPAAGVLVLLLVVVVGAAFWWQGRSDPAAARSGPAPVPVVVATVEQRDVPHLARAIGTVQSIHSVILRSQIDGVLTEVLFKEGQPVTKGDLLARIDARSIRAALNQARAEQARNEAELRAARMDLERYSGLVAHNAVSRQEHDRQQALVAQLEAMVAASQAAVAAAEVQLSYTRIVAPVTGRIGFRRVDPGNYVRAGDADGLFSVIQFAPIDVSFALSQSLLTQLRDVAGTTAPVDVYDRAGGNLLGTGELATIDNQVDRATGTIRLKARLANAEGSLWPGQSVAVQLRTGVSAGARVVPVSAVRHGLEGRFVFRVHEGRVEPVAVKVAFEDADIAVIAEGVAVGDTVVVDGHSRLVAGSRVVPLTADAPAS